MKSTNRIFLILLILGYCWGCESICEPLALTMSCHGINLDEGTLHITNFNLGEDPTALGGALQHWADTQSNIEVMVEYKLGVHATNSEYYAELTLQHNDGAGTKNWSGGGMVLNLSCHSEGIDVSSYDSLQFDIKWEWGDYLDLAVVKLQDVVNDSIPERHIKDWSDYPSPDWETVSIPLSQFGILRHSDTAVHNWVALDPTRVDQLVISVINQKSSGVVRDGGIGVDNVRVVKK